MPEILLATHNAGKLRELRQLAAGLRWRSLDEFPHVAESPESGRTFAENARQKALYYAAATGLPTLADDSGLEVDALHGAPGVHSARFAGEARDALANNRKLVRLLRGVAAADRSARFRCAVAFVIEGRVFAEADGTLDGVICDEPRGDGGFGYDPHFLIPELGLTVAELPAERKNAISHRGQALRRILPRIAALLAERSLWPASPAE